MDFGISTMLAGDGISATDLAIALEDRGLGPFFAGEHTHLPVAPTSMVSEDSEVRRYASLPDPFVMLAFAAAATEQLVIGTSVTLVPQRDPITLAKEVATLDAMSDGRFVFGVGTGWNRGEIANHGVDPAKRGQVLREKVLAMKEIWTEDVTEFHGEFVDFDPLYSWPKPAQRPHPPILVGGGLEVAWPRVLEYGDGWIGLGGGDVDAVAGAVQQFKKRAEGVGRPELTVTITAAPADEEALSRFAEAGVGTVGIDLPRAGRDETLKALDSYAELAARVGRSR